MLKKDITFENLDGEMVTQTFYFHISKAELAKLSLAQEGNMGDYLRKIVESNDNAKIIEEFENILRLCVGERSADGNRFIKSQEISDAFMQSGAYSVMFMDFATSPTAFPEFIAGVLPKDMQEEFALKVKVAETTVFPGLGPATQSEPSKAIERKPEEYSHFELMDMTDSHFQNLLDSIKGNNVPKNVLIAALQRRKSE